MLPVAPPPHRQILLGPLFSYRSLFLLHVEDYSHKVSVTVINSLGVSGVMSKWKYMNSTHYRGTPVYARKALKLPLTD